jgi:hypothetical protein
MRAVHGLCAAAAAAAAAASAVLLLLLLLLALTQCCLMSSWNFSMTRCLVGTAVARHAGNASLAACTAALNSAAVVSGRRETTSCVACRNTHDTHNQSQQEVSARCQLQEVKALHNAAEAN